MPIYEYKCKRCGKTCEAITSEPFHAIDCPHCDLGVAERILSKTTFVLKGKGWAKDNYCKKEG